MDYDVRSILSVSEVNRYIKEIMSQDFLLSNISIKGEISNYKYHSSGHMYFTIKDETSLLKCVMFRTHNMGLKFKPDNGIKVVVSGSVSVFERDGQYQLYVEKMREDGVGDLHAAFIRLKDKLMAEGLFDTKYKKEIPFLPQNIGVVTSGTGAVIRDIINILNRRFPNFSLTIYPVAVQGELAPMQISKAIKYFNLHKCADVIIIARGGGSLEELWAFNEEIVARSIFESDIPIISAVGHETDYTIADFTADLRAPTPSAAAEIVLPEKRILNDKINNFRGRIRSLIYRTINFKKTKYERILGSRIFRCPYDKIYQQQMRIDVLNKYISKELTLKKEKFRTRLSMAIMKLEVLSPLSVLARGYSIARTLPDECVIKSIQNVVIGDEIELKVRDGNINCTVNGIEGGNEDGENKKNV